MATGPNDVRFQGKTGSSRPTTKMTRLTHLGHRRVAPERQRDAARVLPERPRRYCGSGLATGEDIFLDDRVNAPISINHLGDAEVDADRN